MTATARATKPSTRAKPINSRAKGAGGEREFSRVIHQHLGVELVRNLEQSRNGGHDLTTTGTDPVSLALDAYAIEVKRYMAVTPSMLAVFWEQATQQAARAERIPVLAYREDRREWLIVAPLHAINPEIFQPWPGIEWTCTMAVSAFCTLVRERVTA